MTAAIIKPRAFREERFVDSRPSGPFVDRPKEKTLRPIDRWRLKQLAFCADQCRVMAGSAAILYEHLRPLVGGENAAAIAMAAFDRLWEELQELETLHGLELTNEVKREPA